MATLYITEFSSISSSYPAPATPPIAEQHVQIGSDSVTSAEFNDETTFVMLSCDAAACLAFGTAPVAEGHTQYMPANTTRFYGVPKGQGYVVAVIQQTA